MGNHFGQSHRGADAGHGGLNRAPANCLSSPILLHTINSGACLVESEYHTVIRLSFAPMQNMVVRFGPICAVARFDAMSSLCIAKHEIVF